MSNFTFVRHVGDGVTSQYTLAVAGENIGYFRASDIKVYVDDELVSSSIEPSSPHLVLIDSAPPDGSDVLIRREMPNEQPYANFERGNNFGHRQINNTFVQQLYLTQELLDGFYPEGFYLKQSVNFGGYRLINIGKGETSGDAVEYEQWDERATSTENRLLNVEQSTNITPSTTTQPFRYIAVGGELVVPTNFSFGFALLSINGVNQTLGTSFSILDGDFQLAEPLEEGDEVYAVIAKPFSSYATFTGSGDWFYDSLLGGETQIEVGVVFSKMILTINGITQIPTKAYSTLGTMLTLAEPLEAGDEVYAIISS